MIKNINGVETLLNPARITGVLPGINPTDVVTMQQLSRQDSGYVPYTGAIDDVNLGVYSLTAGVTTANAQNTTNTVASLIAKNSSGTQMFGIYNDGHMALGSTNPIAATFRISCNHTGGTTGTGIFFQGQIQSDVTAAWRGILHQPTVVNGINITTFTGITSGTPSLGTSTITNLTYYDTGTELAAVSGNTYAFFSRITAGTNRYNFYANGTAPNYFAGNLGIGQTTATAYLHIKAGTATASTAPIKLTTGANNTVAEAGTIEYNNTFHVTNSDATRRHIMTAVNATKTVAGAPYANDGYITINIGGTDVKVMTTA